MPFNPEAFVESFKASGWYNEEAMGLQPFEGMGWGGVARRDIEPHTPLFHIPLAYLLTPWTSTLRTHLTAAEWESLEGGWARLMLAMMYEESIGERSRWAGYLANMPREFGTPMFWSEGERAELVGTDIADRIGREDAEAEYHTKISPVLAAHPDIFSSAHFSLDNYHVQGSRILSRSFTIPITRAGGPLPAKEENEDGDEDSDDEEEEEPMVAVMVPMADMLNAAYERDNANLFADGEDADEALMGEEMARKVHELGEGYTMITTGAIAAGEQIYNTYASPPNSELLRKYGHVDMLPLPAEVTSLLTESEVGSFPYGNAGDEVEIAGDAVVRTIAKLQNRSESDEQWQESISQRVDWWLEEGEDDTFGLVFGDQLNAPLIAFVRLLTNEDDWARALKKGKVPKDIVDASVCDVVDAVVRDRCAAYPQSMEEDLRVATLPATDREAQNRRNAAVVRLGEKRILAATIRVVEHARAALIAATEAEGGDGKRKREGGEGGEKKRRR